jgi:Ca2+-binding RTX toxin-like protein
MAQLLLASSSLMAAAPASLAEALARVEAHLDAWAADTSAYNSLLLQVFAAAGTEAALWQQAAGELNHTLQSTGLAIRLELLSDDQLPGLNGAYTANAPGGGERIYLNNTWLPGASADQIEAVLLEEIGHAIDQRLNGSADSPGDEGERFSALLRGLTPNPATATENDQFQITLQGQPVLVEAAADTTAPRVNLSGFRNPAFAGSSIGFGLPDVGSLASPTLADIDGDGDLDAFIGNNTGNTLFFRNNGSATSAAFAGSSIGFALPAVGSFASPALADIDGDGDLDAFIGNRQGNTLFFRNNGSATAPAFAGSSIFFGLPDVGSVASPNFADIDGDGDLDAFIGNRLGSTLFFRNTGSATSAAFAGSSIFFGLPDVGGYASPAFADIDGDGDLDAFIGNNSGSTLFFRNTGSATNPAFAGSSIGFGLLGVGSYASPAFADIDGDGDLDAFIGNNDGSTLFFRNTGSGGLTATNPNGSYGPGGTITIEVPFSEVVFVNSAGGTPTLLLETGSTDRAATYLSGSGTRVLRFSYTVQAGDTSADLDVTSSSALALNGGTIKDAAGNNAALTLPAPGATGSLGANAALVIDSLAPTVDLSGFRNPAFAGSSIGFGLPDVGNSASPAFADIDGDGDLDAFIGIFNGSTLFFRNTGSATAPAFAGSSIGFGFPAVGNSASPAFADIDGDGDLDAFIGNRNGTNLFFRNTGSATAPAFAGSSIGFGLPDVGSVASPTFADIDGDGDLDAFIGNNNGSTLFFLNTGSATAPAFAGSSIGFGFPGVGSFASPALFDIDGDGDLDAFIGNGNGSVLFFRNTGSATAPAFAGSSISFGFPGVGSFASPAFADSDGDGDLDAFIGNGSGSTLFFRNTGSGGLTATNPNGSYGPGSAITIEVPFSEVVFVNTAGGTPTLLLETGSIDRSATYLSGSGTRVLRFSYTVQAGDRTADLDVTSSSALALNGGTIRDAAGNNAVLTLPAPGATGSLGANHDLVIDGIAPTVVLSGFLNPAFAGSSIGFGLPDVGFSAKPALADIDGDGDLDAFIGNSQGSTLFFRNTGSGTSPAFAASSIFVDLPDVGFEASPTFADIDGDGDLDAFIGNSNGITLFFRNAGSATSPAFAGASIFVDLPDVGSEASPAFVDIDGDGDLDAFIGNNSGSTLFFRNTGSATSAAFAGSSIGFGLPDVGQSASPAFADIDGDGDLDAFIGNIYGDTFFFRNSGSATSAAFAGSSIGFGLPGVGTFANPAFADIDGDGDLDAFIGNGSGSTLFFRNTGGGISSTNPNGTYGLGSTITIEVPFSEVVFVNTAGATPTLLLETGSIDRAATYLSGSGTRVLRFSYTVQPGDTSADLDVTSSSALALNGGTIRDAAGNNAVLTLPAPGAAGSLGANADLVIDTAAPTVAGVASSSSNGTYGVGSVLTITVQFSEAVVVNTAGGTPTLLLETGSTDRAATYVSGSGSNALTFQYTVEVGDSSADLDVTSSSALALNGGTIQDAAGNNAVLTLSAPGAAGSLGANADLVIDSAAPVITAGPIAVGDSDISITANEAGTAALFKADNSQLFPTALIANTAASLTLAAQATITTASLRVADAAGNLTSAAPSFWLGTTDADAITGTSTADFIYGFSGNDTLTGAAGIDQLVGGDGSDTYTIETVGDLVVEANAVAGTGGIDTVLSSLAAYTLTANVENLTLTGAAAINGTGNTLNNVITGNAAANSLTGDAGNDTLNGAAGIDTMIGGAGSDTYTIETVGDLVIEFNPDPVTGGVDTVLSSLATYTLTANVENLTLTGVAAINGTGNTLNNVITGNTAANSLSGDAGADTLDGGDGADTLNGGSGNDSLIGRAGNDTYIIDSNGDSVVELNPDPITGGIDTVLSSLLNTTLAAKVENLTLTGVTAINGTGNSLNNVITGNTAANSLSGDAGADTLDGGEGADTLNGGSGNDSLIGRAGNDTYTIDSIGDSVVEMNPDTITGGIDTVLSSLLNTTLVANVENLTLTGVAAINGTGNSLNNVITGNTAANSLSGDAGADTLDGGEGADTLNGGSGNDSLTGRGGSDTYIIDSIGDQVLEFNPDPITGGVDTVLSSLAAYTLAANVENLTLTGAAAINGTGNTLNNRLTGNAAANLLSGDAGADTLSGGDGNDTLTGGLGADTFRFDSPLNAVTNGDLITDYTLAQGDRIELENSVFTALATTGALAASAFRSGAAATTADHRILYDSTTGLLSYDSDGNGAAGAIVFATLTPGLALTNSQFTVT